MTDKAKALAHYTEFLAQARANADDDLVHCRTCGQNGPRCTSLEHELVDGMNDRPATRQAFNVSRCECGSDDVEPMEFCVTCNIRPANEPGTDECTVCWAASDARQDANVKAAKELQEELHAPFRRIRDDVPA